MGTDLFHLNDKDYLVVIDYYSNYPEIAQLSSTSADCVITHIKSFFARHGIPQSVVSDNGPQYNCREFRQFAEQYGFQHNTSSPLYPQANGKADKGVQIVKRLLKKARDSETDPYLALLSYRTAPLACGASPAELLMGRKLRTTLPHIPLGMSNKGLFKKQQQLKLKQKENYDKSTRRLEALLKDDAVRIEDHNTWDRKATVLEEVGPRSFTVQTDDGQVLKRNCRSLLKSRENSQAHGQENMQGQQVKMGPDPHSDDSPPPTRTDTPLALRRSTRPSQPLERLIEQV